MRRIVILGNAGSGKSTLAQRLGERLALPVVHMDPLFWEPAWTKPDNEQFRSRVSAAIAGDAWICEGNYARRTFDLRLARADLVIWMDTPRLVCVKRVLMRSAFRRSRPDLPAGCEEQLDAAFLDFIAYTWAFDRKTRPGIEAERQMHGPDVPLVHLRNAKEIEAFLLAAA